MNTLRIIAAARQMLPYTSEFDHDVIRVPVSNKYWLGTETTIMQPEEVMLYERRFYEVEFRKQYVRNVAIGWEFVNIY